MRTRRGALDALAVAALPLGTLLLAPAGVAAHALGGEAGHPLPLLVYLLGAAVAVALSFAFAALRDPSPPPERPPGRLRRLPAWARLTLRGVGLLGWTWVVLQAVAGGRSDAEVASLILWVFGWVGLALVSALLFPVWSWLDPFRSLDDLRAALLRRWTSRRGRRGAVGAGDEAASTAIRAWPARAAAWPAVAFLGVLVWLELVARVEGGRELGLVLIVYSLISVAGMAWRGGEVWREHAEVFSVWFGLLGRLAPWGLEGRPDEGRLRRRGVGSALAGSPWDDSLLALVAVAAGSVIWDGISQTRPWVDLVGQPGLLAESLLLAAFLAAVVALVLGVARGVGRAAMGAGLVPVATGYLVAHYLGALLVDGQRLVVAISDPLQQGWDLFGTATWEPGSAWLTTSALWTIQVVAVVLGHVSGAWLGHAAVRQEADGRLASQWPLAALMVGLTMLALWSLGQELAVVGG